MGAVSKSPHEIEAKFSGEVSESLLHLLRARSMALSNPTLLPWDHDALDNAVRAMLRVACAFDSPYANAAIQRKIENTAIDDLFPPSYLDTADLAGCGELHLHSGDWQRGKGVTW
ncbi:MAG: hypothetical protein ACM31C_17365 [Acidobacteriota bacterium]